MNDDNHALMHQDFVFILALAGRIDAQKNAAIKKPQFKKEQMGMDGSWCDDEVKLFAQQIHKSRYISYSYSVIDSLSSSYSMFKYFFDVCLGGTADDMHELMMDPVGIVTISIEALFLVSFSFLANYFDDDNDNREDYQKWITTAWPYFRDVMKALKNAYKGWRGFVVALNLLGLTDINALIIPVSLGLGLLAAVNRYFIRSITEARKEMMKINAELFISLKKLSSLTADEAVVYLKRIQYQSSSSKHLGYLTAAFGGFIDGLYLYMGALTLAALSPALLMAMASLCVFYTLSCIITRLYEEHDFQLRLMVTQTKCQLSILTRRIQTCHARLLLLQDFDDENDIFLGEKNQLKVDLSALIAQFEMQRQLLEQQSSRSYFSAVLLGIRYGLYAYGALSSILFFTSSLLFMGGIALPPILVVISISLGAVLMLGFLVHSLITQAQHNSSLATNEEQKTPYHDLFVLGQDDATLPSKEQVNKSLKDGLNVKEAPRHAFQELFEVFRSLFSGLSKGQKFVDFSGNPLQEVGADGHYQDTPVMFLMGAINALLFGSVFGLRALARGFGRTASDQDTALTSLIVEPGPVNNEPTGLTKTKGEGELTQKEKLAGSLKSPEELLSLFGLFKKEKPSLTRLGSENTLNNLIDHGDTVVGLA